MEVMVSAAEIFSASILIVDDQAADAELLEQMLRAGDYQSVTSTTNPAAVCALHRATPFDLILLDLQMPKMDGFEVMEGLKQIETTGYVPVMVTTAHPRHKLRALAAGAKDFISKPLDLKEVMARIRNMLEVRLLYMKSHHSAGFLAQQVRKNSADLRDNYVETISTLTRAAQHKDEETGNHVQRISCYSRELARKLGMNDDFVDKIFISSPMHDIGKIGIHDNVLLKPGNLTPDEWDVMKEHALIGSKILGAGKSPYLTMGAEIALNHHERWCGGGYPNGKTGDSIPLAARIMNICDIYDALRSKRTYKIAFSHPEAMHIIAHGDGRTQPEHFDPAILSTFKRNGQLFGEIFDACAA
ncbi:MAG: HD domain-containing phosphohydrolase [Gallionella sp.]